MIQTLFGSLKEAEEPKKRGIFERMREAVTRTRENLSQSLEEIVALTVEIDDKALDDLEMSLISADLGVVTAQEILTALRERALDHKIRDGAELKQMLRAEIKAILDAYATPPRVVEQPPEVILLVGVNGTGKTTTSGKLAAWYRRMGKTVLLCAADTFRAAAIEQLQVWGQRTGAEVVTKPAGSDASGLAFDAVTRAKAEGLDVLIIDTAGRLQNRDELMSELEKIIRVIKKVDSSAPHATLLTLDATTGQNALNQVDIFGKRAGVTGLVMTKLDGTARGGILVAIAKKFGLPVHFIGVGETVDDLEAFAAADFAAAIAGKD
jgi:fused signal recognition particle receptor